MYFSVVHAIDSVIYLKKKAIFKCEIVMFFCVRCLKQDFSTGFDSAGIKIVQIILKYIAVECSKRNQSLLIAGIWSIMLSIYPQSLYDGLNEF